MMIAIFLVLLMFAFSVPNPCDYMPDSVVLESGLCVKAAKCIETGNVIFRKNCLISCPEWVHYYYNETHTCYPDCPEDTVVDGSSCLSPKVCTSKSQVVFNRTCVNACPVRLPYSRDGVCYSHCPKDSVANGTVCVDSHECTKMGKYIFNGTCVRSCPIQTPFIKYGTCLYACTADTVKSGNSSCIFYMDCHKQHEVTYKGNCLAMCPSQAPFNVSGNCSSNCREGLVKTDLSCISPGNCIHTKKKFVFEENCVSACPPEAPYQHIGTCLKQCPQWYVSYEFQCISTSSCTSITEHYRVVYNGSCVKECPDDATIMHERKCYSKCPDELVANDTKCISKDECTHDTSKFIYNGKCVESCPNEAKYMKDGECCQQCPQGSVRERNQCIENDRCKSKGRVIFNGSCVEECPPEFPYEKGGKCLIKCDSIESYTQYGEWHGSIANGTKCIDIMTCILDDHYVYDQACVSQCPTDTATDPSTYSPSIRICYSLNRIKMLASVSTGFCVLCLIVLVSMVYNPTAPYREEVPVQTFLENEEPPESLDTVLVEEEGEAGLLQRNNAQEDQADAEPNYRPLPEVVDEPSRNVIVHNNNTSCDDDVPLLPMENSITINSDDDDDYLFGNGQY